MSNMDNKQRKAQKRKEKLKKEKMRSSTPVQKEARKEARKFGVIQILYFALWPLQALSLLYLTSNLRDP